MADTVGNRQTLSEKTDIIFATQEETGRSSQNKLRFFMPGTEEIDKPSQNKLNYVLRSLTRQDPLASTNNPCAKGRSSRISPWIFSLHIIYKQST